MKGPQYGYNRKSLDNIPPSKLPFILQFKEVNLVQEFYYPLLFLVTNISRSTGHVAIAYILLVSYWWVYLYILRNIIFIGMFYELVGKYSINHGIEIIWMKLGASFEVFMKFQMDIRKKYYCLFNWVILLISVHSLFQQRQTRKKSKKDWRQGYGSIYAAYGTKQTISLLFHHLLRVYIHQCSVFQERSFFQHGFILLHER